MEARIAKQRRKRVERRAGYDNDEDALRWELGSYTELEELEEDMVGRSRGKNMGPIREHWLVHRSSKTLEWPNHMLKKQMERIGRIVFSPLTDMSIYVIKLNYAC